MMGDVVGVDVNGNSIFDNGDGTYTVAAGGFSAGQTYNSLAAAQGDISMTTQPPNPPIQPVNPPGNTAGVSSWLNSAGAFGVSIASILSGRPAVAGGGQYRTGAQVQTQPQINVGSLILFGLGVLLLVKLLK